jgi:hypothetical protein
LLLACGLAVVGDLVTIFVNVPINNRLATSQWHQVRLVAMFMATCLVFAAMIVRK